MAEPAAPVDGTRRMVVWLVTGLAALLLSALASLGDVVNVAEAEVFQFVNEWPDWLEVPGWPVMQAGAIAIVPLAAVAAYAAWRRWGPAMALLGAGFAAWVLAKVVKEIVERGRPAALLPDVAVRGDWIGLGFPSGHVAVAFSLATVADAYLRGAWRWAAWAVAAATGVMRMYTAAHLPLDIVGGAGLGVAIGAAIRLAMGSRRAAAQSPPGRRT